VPRRWLFGGNVISPKILHKHRGGKNIDARDVSSIAPFSSGGYAGRTNATAESLGGIISA
jgi:hypothetical protein